MAREDVPSVVVGDAQAPTASPRPFAHLSTQVSGLYAAVYLHYGAFGLFMPMWFAHRGLSVEQIGTLMSVPMLLRLLFVAPVANLADRLRRIREVLFVCVLGCMLLMTGMSFASDYWQLLLFFTVFSLVWDPLPILVDAYAVVAVRAQALDFGRMRLWGSVAFIGANFACGKLIETYSVQIVPWLTAALLAVPLLPIMLLPPDRLLGPPTKAAPTEWRRILADPAVFGAMIAVALIGSSHAVLLALGAIQWSKAGLSAGTIGGLVALSIAAEIVVLFGAQKMLGTRSPLWLIVIGAVVAVVRWCCMALDPPLPALVVLQLLNGFTGMGIVAGLMMFISKRVDAHLISTAQGVNAVVLGVLAAGATAASGFAWRAFGQGAYIGMAALAALGGAMTLYLLRRKG